MAWVSRSIRDFDLSKNNTNEMLGPGSYIAHEPFVKQPKFASAPFCSTEKRKSVSSNEKFQTPGPGSYQSPTAFNVKNDGLSVFKSATTRFNPLNVSASQEVPGMFFIPQLIFENMTVTIFKLHSALILHNLYNNYFE